MYMVKGGHVEVEQVESGLESSFFEGSIVEVNEGGKTAVVRYFTLTDDDSPSKALEETVAFASIRPRPPEYAYAKPLRSYNVGENVDCYYADGWWRGFVDSISESGLKIGYPNYPHWFNTIHFLEGNKKKNVRMGLEFNTKKQQWKSREGTTNVTCNVRNKIIINNCGRVFLERSMINQFKRRLKGVMDVRCSTHVLGKNVLREGFICITFDTEENARKSLLLLNNLYLDNDCFLFPRPILASFPYWKDRYWASRNRWEIREKELVEELVENIADKTFEYFSQHFSSFKIHLHPKPKNGRILWFTGDFGPDFEILIKKIFDYDKHAFLRKLISPLSLAPCGKGVLVCRSTEIAEEIVRKLKPNGEWGKFARSIKGVRITQDGLMGFEGALDNGVELSIRRQQLRSRFLVRKHLPVCESKTKLVFIKQHTHNLQEKCALDIRKLIECSRQRFFNVLEANT